MSNTVVETNHIVDLEADLLDTIRNKLLMSAKVYLFEMIEEERGFKPEMVMKLLRKMMLDIEKTAVKGTEQKKVVLYVVHYVVNELDEGIIDGNLKRTTLDMIMNGTLGDAIELIIQATRGQLDINKAIEVGTKCVDQCLPLCGLGKKKKSKKVSV